MIFPLHIWCNLKIISHPELQYLCTCELKTLLDLPSIKYIKKDPASDSDILDFYTYHLSDSVPLGWDTCHHQSVATSVKNTDT